jgi:AraC-like DNA-binding protein/mannose-6-phosphate isomerase-like protein (cupin superfamily)
MNTHTGTRFEDIAVEQKLKYSCRCFKQKYHNSNVMTASHWHNYIELLFFNSGYANIYLSGKPYRANQGDLVIVNSREAHYIESDDKSTEYTVIQFDPEMLHMSSTVFALKYIIPFSSPDKKYPRLFSDEFKLPDIKERVNRIYEEYTNQEYAYELSVQGNIIMLFLDIVRAWHKYGIEIRNDINIKERDLEWLNEAMSFIDKNYSQNISAKDVSKVCLMSYNYFTTRFKQLLGHSFSSHLNSVRLRHAEYDLMATDKSITEIAYDCGFSSTSYFISMFSKHKNTTPQNYRKKIMESK